MNRNFAVAVLGTCCLAAGITLAGQTGADASSSVQRLEKEMRQAEKSGDITWYQQHLADGYVEGRSWGDWATKGEAIKQLQDKSIKVNKAEIGEMKVSSFGPNVAVAHYTYTYDATFNGTHRARTVICSDTWISQSGAWKLASDHCSHVEGK